MKQTVTFSYEQFSFAKMPLKAAVYIVKKYLVINYKFFILPPKIGCRDKQDCKANVRRALYV